MSPKPHPADPAMPRVVIVDADRRVQQSLADLLRVTGKVEVVARVGDVRSALEAIERTSPDVLLVDPRLPDVEAGRALIAGVNRAWPGLQVVLTGWNGSEGELIASEGRPITYVSKDGSPDEFVSALVSACGCS